MLCSNFNRIFTMPNTENSWYRNEEPCHKNAKHGELFTIENCEKCGQRYEKVTAIDDKIQVVGTPFPGGDKLKELKDASK